MTIVKLWGGGKDYSHTFSLAMNIIELTDFFEVVGLVACSPRKFLILLISDTVSVGF